MWSSEKARACMSVALVILVSGIFLVPRLYLAAQMPDTTPQVRIFVISDEELQKHHMHYKAKEVFREVLRINYPAWAEYSQQLTFGKMVVTHDLTTIIWNAGAECAERCPYPISVNPSVLLTVLILKYGEAPPSGFNAHQAVRQIALDIKRLHEEGRTQPEVWQDRFANLGSYVMYRLVGADERRMGGVADFCIADWCPRPAFSRKSPRRLHLPSSSHPHFWSALCHGNPLPHTHADGLRLSAQLFLRPPLSHLQFGARRRSEQSLPL